MDMKVELLGSFSFCRKVVLAFDEKRLLVPTCLAMSCQLETSEEETSEEVTVKEVIVREPLNFFSDFSVEIVLETVIVQSAYVPSLRELKVMVLLPEIAMVVLEEHEPP